ncbi:DNA ligase-1 [Geoalkalibacter ferrihydriticus]|nr:DNA ligase [Geoalkalibacter ferrihydriticus]SDM00499.1 DNA ligase-1 [Geoalkalibacter ferrihydriticus]
MTTKITPRQIPFFLMFILSWFAVASAVWAGQMLPQAYSAQVDVSGWLMSEKLDGVRGRWDGRELRSKNGHLFRPPEAFIRGLPDFPLEGEIWGGRETFGQTAAVVQRARDDEGWLGLQFVIFDVPAAEGGFTDRIAKARAWFAAHPSDYAFVIPQVPVRDRAHLREELRRVESLGGEGLIVRKPDALYLPGRSTEILKVKNYQDAEALVIAHFPGSGRNTGRLGSLLAELPDGTRFKVGSGFSDAERENPPPVGAIITFKYYGFYPSGIPKFPSFLRLRQDQDL